MKLRCGHIELPWPIVSMLGEHIDTVWCERCHEWLPFRKATTADIAAHVQETLF